MSYQDTVKAHMAKYTTSEITNPVKGGLFRGKPYPHILNIQKNNKNAELNILPDYRKEIYANVMCNIKTHMYFHHLNSSQAMCINFFYPLIKGNMMSSILSLINSNETWGNVTGWAFEKKSEDEEQLKKKFPRFGEPTNFDFYIETDKGIKVSFEIKYTEAEFGMAEKKDGSFVNKYNVKFRAYKSIMKDWHIKNTKKNDFLTNYQLMRNILFLQDEKRYVVFLIPKGNKKVANQAPQTKDWVKDNMKDHVSVLYWEDVVPTVREFAKVPLQKYYEEFYEKYLDLGIDNRQSKHKK